MSSGCANTLVATVEPVCEVVKGTRVSKDDKLTEGTARSIRQDIEGLRKLGCQAPADAPPVATKAEPKLSYRALFRGRGRHAFGEPAARAEGATGKLS